jgi:hypothetical protein
MHNRSFPLVPFLLAMGCWTLPAPVAAQLQVTPTALILDNPESTQQLLVRFLPLAADATRLATYESLDPTIATVDANGLVQPRAEGRTEIGVR